MASRAKVVLLLPQETSHGKHQTLATRIETAVATASPTASVTYYAALSERFDGVRFDKFDSRVIILNVLRLKLEIGGDEDTFIKGLIAATNVLHEDHAVDS